MFIGSQQKQNKYFKGYYSTSHLSNLSLVVILKIGKSVGKIRDDYNEEKKIPFHSSFRDLLDEKQRHPELLRTRLRFLVFLCFANRS